MTPPASDHFNGKTFFQPHHSAFRPVDFWRWRLTTRPKRWPRSVAVPPAATPPSPAPGALAVTWIGHASFLLQSAQSALLIDPVFSDRVSPVTWAGPRRVHPPGLAFEQLPRIDAVLLSHDHYDHCDTRTLRALATVHQPHFIAPLRHRELLRKLGALKITELDWWESTMAAPAWEVTLTPSKHWSNRFGTPRNHRLWGGFSVRGAEKNVWFVGDTGFDAGIIDAVRIQCGAPDLALVPIGAYEPRWFMAPMHMNPAEAVALHQRVGATTSIGMHWGTFQLTDEGRDEPVEALALARAAAGVAPTAFRALQPGETYAC
jgi:L-ascorbate metabolism protein UlaG (beta-lactamase superfamily)